MEGCFPFCVKKILKTDPDFKLFTEWAVVWEKLVFFPAKNIFRLLIFKETWIGYMKTIEKCFYFKLIFLNFLCSYVYMQGESLLVPGINSETLNWTHFSSSCSKSTLFRDRLWFIPKAGRRANDLVHNTSNAKINTDIRINWLININN